MSQFAVWVTFTVRSDPASEWCSAPPPPAPAESGQLPQQLAPRSRLNAPSTERSSWRRGQAQMPRQRRTRAECDPKLPLSAAEECGPKAGDAKCRLATECCSIYVSAGRQPLPFAVLGVGPLFLRHQPAAANPEAACGAPTCGAGVLRHRRKILRARKVLEWRMHWNQAAADAAQARPDR